MKKIYLFLFIASVTLLNAQITVTTGGTALALAQAIAGNGIAVSNAVLNCGSVSYGLFANGNTGVGKIGLTNGVLLTTGQATDAVGTAAGIVSYDSNSPSYVGSNAPDVNLTAIASNADLNTCKLEFDLVPICDNLEIKYVFASEEYPDFVCSTYNDAFAFFISGPGITGSKNIAVVPGTTMGVAINSINNGIVGSAGIAGGCTSTAYTNLYVNNATGTQIEYNGFTTPLTASASITPCQTYHLKIVIADAGDTQYDSGVFLLQDGVTCITPVLTATASPTSICAGQSSTLTASGSVSGTYTWTPNTNLSTNSGSIVVASPLSSTIYTVSTNGICGQIITQTVSIAVIGVGTPSITAAGPFCISNPTVNLIGTPSGGIWSGSGITNTLSGIFSPTIAGVGSHSISYQITGACGGITTKTIIVNNNPTISVNSATICSGSTATLTANGATNYTWSPGTTLSSISGSMVTANPSATTNYTLLGAIGTCTGTATADIIVNGNPTLTVNSASICPNSTATLTVNGAVNYTWSPATTLSSSSGSLVTANPLISTVYTIYGAIGTCTSSITSTVAVSNNLSISVNNDTICEGSTATLIATGATNYTWSPSATLSSSNGSSVNANPLSTTNYTILGAVGTCTGTTTANVLVNSNPTITVNSSTICEGFTATLTANGATNYTWSPATTLSSSSGSLVTGNPSTTTNYIIIGTVGTCTGTTTADIIVNSNPTITVNNASICPTSTAALIVTGADSYTWSPSTTLSSSTGSIVIGNPLVTTNYTITGAVGLCTGTTTTTILVITNPTITVSSVTICPNSTAILTASGATNYTWSPSSTLSSSNGSSVIANPLSTTNYTILGAIGTCTGVTTADVFVSNNPTITVNSPSICEGFTATLTANGATNYTWSPSTTLSSSSGSTVIASPLQTTNYTIVGSIGSCTASITQTVTVYPKPVPDFNFINKCINAQPNSFDAIPSTIAIGKNTNYAWAFGDGAIINDSITAASHSYMTAGVFNVTLTVTSDRGCVKSAVKQVEVYKKPFMTVVNSPACDGSAISFTANTTANSGSVNAWFWDVNNSITTIELNGQYPSYTFSTAGTQTIHLIAETNHGCRDTSTYNLFVDYNPNPLFTVDYPSGCPLHCVTFTSQTPAIPLPSKITQWIWTLGDGTVLTNTTGATVNHCYNNTTSNQLSQFDVKLQVITSSGCSKDLNKLGFITVYPTPIAQYTVNPNPGSVVDPLEAFINQSIDYTKWWWNFGDGSKIDSVKANPYHTYSDEIANTYHSQLIVANKYGCLDTAYVLVEIAPDFTFYIPNAFTPNNEDGRNDFFGGMGVGIDKYEMWIFDRWGAMIFYTNDIYKGWNGKVQGHSEEGKQDVYTWKVKLKDVLGKTHQYIGHVTLLK